MKHCGKEWKNSLDEGYIYSFILLLHAVQYYAKKIMICYCQLYSCSAPFTYHPVCVILMVYSVFITDHTRTRLKYGPL